MNPVNIAKLTPSARLKGDSAKDTRLLNSMLEEATSFIKSFDWCAGVHESFFGLGIGGVVAVFLFHIEPARKGVDDWLWVVSGDLPIAYLVVDESPDPVSALCTYVNEMRQWVEAARLGTPVVELIPVNVEPNLENAEKLANRLDFLESEIIPMYS